MRRKTGRASIVRERGTLVLSIVLCSGLAIGSYWLAQKARLADVVTRKPGHDVDYTADDITLTRMDATGRALYTIDASRLVHYADDDSGELTRPRLVGTKRDRPEMRVRADLGKTTTTGEEVRLYGDVVVTRQPWKGVAAMVAKSPYLLAYPDREVVETDRPVEVVRGGSRVDAQSMTYDNATQKIHFGSGPGGRVHEVLEAHVAKSRLSTDTARPQTP